MEFKRKFNMEDSPPHLVQSLFTGCSNQRQVCTPPRPIISQGITFKDPLHGRHRSSAELRPSSSPLSTIGSQLLPYQGLCHLEDRIPGVEDVPNHKMSIQTHFHPQHSHLPQGSERQRNNLSLINSLTFFLLFLHY
ncbi:hypothetical protein AMECASPLE_023095, partial [Ameca splendens]